MAGVMRSQFTENMKQDMYSYYWDAYPTKPMVHELLFETINSSSAYEQFTSAIGLGELLEKPEGEDIQAQVPIESYTIVCKNRAFAAEVRFSYEAVSDSKKIGNMVQETVGSWGRSIPITQEKFFAKFINYGAYTAGHDVFNGSITGVVTDPSGVKIYDGQTLFSDAHPDKVGNTYDNFAASSTLSGANLKTAYLAFTVTNAKDERGNVIDLKPDTLLINPALKFTAQEILQSENVPSSMDNTTNVLRSIVEPLEWSYISGTDDWVLMTRGKGLLKTMREEPILDFFQDDRNKDYYANIFTRWGGCVTNWRYLYGANLATS